MQEYTRRETMALATTAGLFTLLAAAGATGQEAKPRTDRECVLAAGMTEEEADCWAAAADTAAKFFRLPKLHDSDAQEIAQAIHVIQSKLLARPTYRRYLELAREGR